MTANTACYDWFATHNLALQGSNCFIDWCTAGDTYCEMFVVNIRFMPLRKFGEVINKSSLQGGFRIVGICG